MSDPTPGPTIEPTTLTQVLVAAALGAGVAWLLFATLVDQGRSLPVIGPVAWLSVLVLLVGIGYLNVRARRELAQREPLEPQQAVTWLLLGKTSVLGGSGLGGAYAALAGVAAQGLPAPLAFERVTHSAIAAGVCLAWAVAGFFLERALRLPPDDPDQSSRLDGDSAPPDQR